jgi:hypothetical protein
MVQRRNGGRDLLDWLRGKHDRYDLSQGYTFTHIQEWMVYTIRLQTTRPCFGGLRWWFTCPLLRLRESCNQRLSKLYLPPCGHYYSCRYCYDLTYQSTQEDDKRVDFYRQHPEAVMAALESLQNSRTDYAKVLLALKALRP